jgi:hypothetical protein
MEKHENDIKCVLVKFNKIARYLNEKTNPILNTNIQTLPTLLATWKQRGLNLQEALSNALTEAWQRIRENERNRRPTA